MTRGCSPSLMYLSACFISSPIRRTVEVVPSLQEGKVEVHCTVYRTSLYCCLQLYCTAEIAESHPVMSSCATAVLAIITAVGFCICISRSSTFPSFVSLISARLVS